MAQLPDASPAPVQRSLGRVSWPGALGFLFTAACVTGLSLLTGLLGMAAVTVYEAFRSQPGVSYVWGAGQLCFAYGWLYHWMIVTADRTGDRGWPVEGGWLLGSTLAGAALGVGVQVMALFWPDAILGDSPRWICIPAGAGIGAAFGVLTIIRTAMRGGPYRNTE